MYTVFCKKDVVSGSKILRLKAIIIGNVVVRHKYRISCRTDAKNAVIVMCENRNRCYKNLEILVAPVMSLFTRFVGT